MAFTDNTTGGRIIKEGILPIRLTLTDDCLPGDLIGYDSISNEAWERADANAKVYASFIAGEAGASGDSIVCFRQAYVSGFTDLAAGKLLYLSDTVGQYAAAPTGNYQQCVGIGVSTTEALVRPDCLPVMSYSSEADSTGLGVAGFFRAELVDGTAATHFGGVKIETKVNTTADTIPTARSLYIYHQTNAATSDTYDNCLVRLEDGGSTVANSFIDLACGISSGPTYFIRTTTAPTTCISKTGALSLTQSGWIKCYIGDGVRYLALYSA